jgi:hypothetical protein
MDEEFSSALCPIGFLRLASTLQDLPSDSPAACRSACRRRRASPRTGSANERSSPAPGLSWSATRSIWPCPTTSHGDGQVQTDASAGPAPPAPASSTRLRLRQTTSRAWTQRATTPTPAIPAVRRPAPPPRSRTSLRPDTADAATHRHRTPTPDADTGRRTADTWTLRRPHRTPVPWTGKRGHRTLAEDVDRATKARPASGPPGPPRRATARWDAQPCSCGRRLRRSTTHAGSAVRPPSSGR